MQIYLALVSLQSKLAGSSFRLQDAPALIRQYNFSDFEVLDRELAKYSPAELKAVSAQCAAHACGVVVDVGCDLTHAAGAAAQTEIKHLENMIDVAVLMGCTIVRITLGGQAFSVQKLLRRGGRDPKRSRRRKARGLQSLLSHALARRMGYRFRALASNFLPLSEVRMMQAINNLKDCLPYAQQRGIDLAIENHWGITSRAEWIMKVIDAIGSNRIGTCPDFGNFPSGSDRYAALELLAPAALHVQAKCWHFSPGGEESTIDYERCINELRRAGYDKTIAVEYEGGGDELGACLRARDLIQRYL